MKILNVSDLHLRHNRPICRTDKDWLGSQQRLVDWMYETAEREKVDFIMDNGDTFHVATQPHPIINIIPNARALHKSKIPWICMPGNHSLQYHQIKNLPESALSTLGYFEGVIVLKNCNDDFESVYKDIPIVHRLIFPDLKSVPFYLKDKGDQHYEHAEQLLEKYPHHDLVLTGDYHHSFHFEKDGRHVVNPGCINIQEAGMIDYQPKAALINYDPGKKVLVTWLDIPDDISQTSNEHILKVIKSEEGIENLIKVLEDPESTEPLSLDFWVEMEAYLEHNEGNLEPGISDHILNKIKPVKSH